MCLQSKEVIHAQKDNGRQQEWKPSQHDGKPVLHQVQPLHISCVCFCGVMLFSR